MIQIENSKARQPVKGEGHQGLGLENVREALNHMRAPVPLQMMKKGFRQ